MSRNIIRNQNVLDPPHRKARRSTAPYERLIETVTIKVWDKGCTDGTREEYRAKALTNATDIGSCLGIPVVFVAYDQMSQATIRRKLYKKLSKEELKILREDFAKEDHSHEL